MKKILVGATMGVLVWNIVLYFLPEKNTTAHYLYNLGYSILYLIGTVVGIRASMAVSTKSSLGKTLLFLGLGNAGYAMGLLIWVYYNLAAHFEIPYPSLADFFFLLVFVPMMAVGLIYLLRIYGTAMVRQYILWGVGIFAVSGALVFGFIMKPDMSRDLPLLTRIFNVLYPLSDTVLLTGAILALLSGGGRLGRGVLILAIGLFFQVCADFLFSWRTSQGTYWNGDIADLFYTLSGAILSWAIITLAAHFSQTNTTPSVSEPQAPSSARPSSAPGRSAVY